MRATAGWVTTGASVSELQPTLAQCGPVWTPCGGTLHLPDRQSLLAVSGASVSPTKPTTATTVRAKTTTAPTPNLGPARQASHLASRICYACNHSLNLPARTRHASTCTLPLLWQRPTGVGQPRRAGFNMQQRRPANAARTEPPKPTPVQRFHPYQ